MSGRSDILAESQPQAGRNSTLKAFSYNFARLPKGAEFAKPLEDTIHDVLAAANLSMVDMGEISISACVTSVPHAENERFHIIISIIPAILDGEEDDLLCAPITTCGTYLLEVSACVLPY